MIKHITDRLQSMNVSVVDVGGRAGDAEQVFLMVEHIVKRKIAAAFFAASFAEREQAAESAVGGEGGGVEKKGRRDRGTKGRRGRRRKGRRDRGTKGRRGRRRKGRRDRGTKGRRGRRRKGRRDIGTKGRRSRGIEERKGERRRRMTRGRKAVFSSVFFSHPVPLSLCSFLSSSAHVLPSSLRSFFPSFPPFVPSSLRPSVPSFPPFVPSSLRPCVPSSPPFVPSSLRPSVPSSHLHPRSHGETDARFPGGDMGADDAGEGVGVGEGDRVQPQLGGAEHQLIGVAPPGEEGEVARDRELGIGDAAAAANPLGWWGRRGRGRGMARPLHRGLDRVLPGLDVGSVGHGDSLGRARPPVAVTPDSRVMKEDPSSNFSSVSVRYRECTTRWCGWQVGLNPLVMRTDRACTCASVDRQPDCVDGAGRARLGAVVRGGP